MPELKYGNWRDSYQQALVELDPARLRQKVLDAETAIFRQLQQLGVQEERMAINDAIANLRVLQQEKLQFPGWKSA